MIRNIVLVLCIIFVGCKGNAQKEEMADTAETKTKTEFTVTKTKAEWKKILADDEYYVLREAATESPFTSDLLENKVAGTYVCAGCGTELFKSETKFDSGTGWPSFYEEITGNVAYDVDYKVGYERTEEHCATCGGHLGHVFKDGPAPTGLRHCVNGVALNFVPDTK